MTYLVCDDTVVYFLILSYKFFFLYISEIKIEVLVIHLTMTQ